VITYHEVPPEHFTALASGRGGPAAIQLLAGVQHSKHLLLLRFLADARAGDPDHRAAVDLLVQADRRDRTVVADLVRDPMVGAWAVQVSRRLVSTTDDSTAVPPGDLAQLGALAAVAAIRTGLDAEVRTHALSGAVTLPTLGAAVLGPDGPAIVTVSGGRATVSDGSTEATVSGHDRRWLPLRRLAARHGDLAGSLVIEDGNPYRDCYHAPAASRLTAAEVRHWQDTFDEAWRLLAELAPERAAELAAGLRSVVPLVTTDDGVARSGTARDAFGTLGLTRPRSAADLAVTLVHEFQHSKLGVLLDLVPLHTLDGRERHFAPWRTDARPTSGLVHGIYAFLGVADTWRALREQPALAEMATREFVFTREQIAVGMSALEGSTELTQEGRRFAAELRRAVDRLLGETVPKSAMRAASERLSQRREAWHRHNSETPTVESVNR
jgi:uncharacterized protein